MSVVLRVDCIVSNLERAIVGAFERGTWCRWHWWDGGNTETWVQQEIAESWCIWTTSQNGGRGEQWAEDWMQCQSSGTWTCLVPPRGSTVRSSSPQQFLILLTSQLSTSVPNIFNSERYTSLIESDDTGDCSQCLETSARCVVQIFFKQSLERRFLTQCHFTGRSPACKIHRVCYSKSCSSHCTAYSQRTSCTTIDGFQRHSISFWGSQLFMRDQTSWMQMWIKEARCESKKLRECRQWGARVSKPFEWLISMDIFNFRYLTTTNSSKTLGCYDSRTRDGHCERHWRDQCKSWSEKDGKSIARILKSSRDCTNKQSHNTDFQHADAIESY